MYSAFRVLNNGASSKHFQVISSVEQECVFALKLFNLMLVAVLTKAFDVTSLGIPIRYRCHEKIHNFRCSH